jgi:hypothetical protein
MVFASSCKKDDELELSKYNGNYGIVDIECLPEQGLMETFFRFKYPNIIKVQINEEKKEVSISDLINPAAFNIRAALSGNNQFLRIDTVFPSPGSLFPLIVISKQEGIFGEDTLIMNDYFDFIEDSIAWEVQFSESCTTLAIK